MSKDTNEKVTKIVAIVAVITMGFQTWLIHDCLGTIRSDRAILAAAKEDLSGQRKRFWQAYGQWRVAEEEIHQLKRENASLRSRVNMRRDVIGAFTLPAGPVYWHVADYMGK